MIARREWPAEGRGGAALTRGRLRRAYLFVLQTAMVLITLILFRRELQSRDN